MTQAELAALGQGITVQPLPQTNSGLGGTLGGIYGAPQTGFFNNLPAGSPNMPGFGSIPTLPTGTPTGLTNNGNTIYASGMDNFSLNTPTPTVGGTTPVASPQGQGISSGTSVPVNTNSPYAYGRPPDSPLNQFNSATGLPNPNWNGANTGGTGTGTGTGTPTTGTPTAPANSMNNLYQTYVDPNQGQLDSLYGITNDISQETNPTKILNNTLSQYQAQIDATNAMFADQLNSARIQGQGRIESRQFAQGRAGQIGSGTGEAGVNAVQDANRQIERSIQAEQAAAIQAILTQTRNEAAEILKANTEAKKQGAKGLLEFLNVTQPAKKAKITSNAVSALIKKGVDISNMTPEEIKSYTDGIGISENDFRAAYSAELAAQQKAKNEADKAAADLAKTQADIAKTQAETGQVGKMTPYQSAQLAIDWYKAKNPTMSGSDKKLNAIGGIATLFSPSEKDANGASITTIPNSGGIPYVDNNGFITPEGFKTVLREAAGEVTRKEILDQFGSQLSPTQYALYGLTAKEIADISNS